MLIYCHVFEGITDPRRSHATRHDLHEMLMITLLTVLSDGKTSTDMAPFGREKKAFLYHFMALKHGIPSHDAFSDLFNCPNPQELDHMLARLSVGWSDRLKDRLPDTADGVIALVGLSHAAGIAAEMLRTDNNKSGMGKYRRWTCRDMILLEKMTK